MGSFPPVPFKPAGLTRRSRTHCSRIPAIECTVLIPGGASGDFSAMVRQDQNWLGMPPSQSELFAYDAIILSDVPREVIDEKHLAWLEDWIARRGGGLCMVGGPRSFGSGRWNDTSVGNMLPVELVPAPRDWDDTPVGVHPEIARTIHPIWHLTSDEAQNRAAAASIPLFLGSNRVGAVKPGADVLASCNTPGTEAELRPAVVVQPYGRGRTMVMTTGITRRWAGEFTQSWGGADARYFKKFWRNVVYWLTENSSTGRRRLLAETDKRLYRPGEPIVLRAQAFDENAAPTVDYRVAVTVEPKSASDFSSEKSPLLHPEPDIALAKARKQFLPWSEEFELPRDPAEKSYRASFPIGEAGSLPTGVTLNQGLRFELTAFEDNTQVDSLSLEVQVLDDPFEQQNPLPDHDLLRRIAGESGGTVLRDAKDLSAMMERLPRTTAPPEVKKTPAWSRWPLLLSLLSLLTIEWVWRRWVGLA